MESKQEIKTNSSQSVTKKWVAQNRDRYNAYQREYRKTHYERIRERERRAYETKKAPYECECGARIIEASITSHMKTEKHKRGLRPV